MTTSTTEVRVRAPGKLNLALAVGSLREDGYHPLATVFQAVSAYEEVTARPADDLTLTVSGLGADAVPTDGSNLALRAAHLLARATGVEPRAALHVRKGVPTGGGMAGGSADAAATLLACDALWQTGLPRARLAELAAELGADVPFPLHGQTAVGRGRGDLLTPALSRGEYHWALALRADGLSTPEVFARFDAMGGDGVGELEVPSSLLQALRAGDAVELGRVLVNDLQPVALDLLPDLADTFEVVREAGALGALVSGSGPTVAALGRNRQHALALAAAVTAAGVADDVLCVVGPVPGARLVAPVSRGGSAGDPAGPAPTR